MLANRCPTTWFRYCFGADRTLITHDAWADLGYLDRIAAGPRSDRGSRVHPDPPANVCDGHRAVVRAANRNETGGRPVRAGPRREHPLVARPRKRCAIYRVRIPGARQPVRSMGAIPTAGCPHIVPKPTARGGVRRGRVSSPLLTCRVTRPDMVTDQIRERQFVHAVSLASQWRFCGVLPISPSDTARRGRGGLVAEKISYPMRLHWSVRAQRPWTG